MNLLHKTLFGALLATTQVGLALAQSNVTLFGVIDEFVGVTRTGGETYKRLDSSGLMGSRLGFRGSEDLGDGLRANFWLETGINTDTGAQADATRFFNRQAWVGLSGGFGEARFGRQNSPQFIMSGRFDAFDGSTYGSAFNSLAFYLPRFDNAFSYTTPQWGPVKLRLLSSLNETDTGRRFGATVGAIEYESGPLYLGTNYAETQNAKTQAVTKSAFFGGNYDFGPVKLFGGYHYASSSDDALRQDTYSMSVSYRPIPLLALAVGVARANDKTKADSDATHLSAGAFYDLSKRTLLYGVLARINNKNSADFSLNTATAFGIAPSPGNNVTGLQLGIRHQF